MTATGRRTSTGLGRGLAALIPQRPAGASATEIPIERIRRNPQQPRREADRDGLEALARSIAAHGVLQPILVSETVDGYQLIAGERRLRAAEMAGLERVPALVRADVAEHDQLELALVENLQRADLNPLDEALAFRRLIDEFGLSQEQIAGRVARARSSVANTLRLLELAEAVQAALRDGHLSEGHARAIGGIADHAAQEQTLGVVVERGLSVRQTEELARRHKGAADRPGRAVQALSPPGDPDLERFESDLRTALGTKVTLTSGRKGGRIIIEYYDGDDLGRLYERLVGRRA